MSKLLSAEFRRLFHSLVFKIAAVFSILLAVLLVVVEWSISPPQTDGMIILMGSIYLMFAYPVLVGMFLGTEYSDGTMRNKLIVGHKRSSIYLSKLIVCAVADIIVQVVNSGVSLILAVILYDKVMITCETVVMFAVSIGIILAFTTILVVFAMSIQSKAAGAVICLLLTIVMLMCSIFIMERLNEPEYYEREVYQLASDGSGDWVETDVKQQKNPYYISGTTRKIYEFLDDLLPFSQLMQIMDGGIDNISAIYTNDIGMLVVFTGIGVWIFWKRDLK